MNDDYFESEEFKEILRMYEEGIAQGGSVYLDAEDFMDVIDYYMYEVLYDEAEECIDRAISAYPDDYAMLVMKGSCCICQKKYEEAVAIHERLDPSLLDVMYQRGQIQYALYHNNVEAEKIWRDWIDRAVKEEQGADVERDCYMHILASIMELRDTSLFEMSDYEKKYYLRWLSEYEEKYSPLGESDYDEMIAETLSPSVFPDEVIRWYTQILERRPYMQHGWCRLAVAYLVVDKFAQCAEAADFALAVNPDDTDAMATKANALFELEAWDGALAEYKHLREKGGSRIHNINMALAYLKIGEPTQAYLCLNDLKAELDSYMHQLETGGEHAALHGVPVVLEGMHIDAFKSFYCQVFTEISEKLRDNGRFRESDKFLLAVAKYDPENSYIYLCLAENSFVEKNWTKCHEYFNKAMCCGGGKQRVDLGVKFAIYLLASGYHSMCCDILKKCDEMTELTYMERCFVDVAWSYYYMIVSDKEKFFEYYKKTEDSGIGFGVNFNRLYPMGTTLAEKIAYIDKHFVEMREGLGKELSVIAGTAGADDEAESHEDVN